MKLPTLFLTTILTLLALVACTPESAAPKGDRLFAHSPALTELLFKIGAGEKVVGTSPYTTYPAAAARLPKVGVLPINLEALHELKASAIVCQNSSPKLTEFARSEKVALHELPIESLDDLRATLLKLGQLTGHEAEAKAEWQRIEQAFKAVRKQRASFKQRPRALICVGRSPGALKQILTPSSGFLVEAVAACGVDNAFADLKGQYTQLSLEAVIDRDPDLIIEIHGKDLDEATVKALKSDWSALGKLKAVKTRQILVISGKECLIPGPRVTSLLAKLAAALPRRSP